MRDRRCMGKLVALDGRNALQPPQGQQRRSAKGRLVALALLVAAIAALHSCLAFIGRRPSHGPGPKALVPQAAVSATSPSAQSVRERLRVRLPKITKPELVAICKQEELKAWGNKKELIERIVQYSFNPEKILEGIEASKRGTAAPAAARAEGALADSPGQGPQTEVAEAPPSFHALKALMRSSSGSPGFENTANLNADFFHVPRGHLPAVYSCEGRPWKGNHDLVQSWQRQDWAFIANVLPGNIYLGVDIGRTNKAPDFYSECVEVDQNTLTEKQYAEIVGATLDVLSKARSRTKTREVTDWLDQNGYRIALEPKFQFKGVAAKNKATDKDEAYIYATMSHEAIPPKDLNFGRLEATRQVAAALVGLKVYPVVPVKGETQLLEVCEPSADVTLTETKRQELLSYKLQDETRHMITNAREGTLILTVSRNCASEKFLKMTYLASALTPSLSERNQQLLKRVPSFESWQPMVISATNTGSTPGKRQQLIEDELEHCRGRLNWPQPLRRATSGEEGMDFQKLAAPQLVVGGGVRTSASQSGAVVWKKVKSAGLFAIRPDRQAAVRLRGICVGTPSEGEKKRTQEILRGVRRDLKAVKIDVEAPPGDESEVFIWDDPDVDGVVEVLKKAQVGPEDAVLLFATKALGAAAERLRARFKYEALLTEIDGGSGLHLASQWVDLPGFSQARRGVWMSGSNDYYALQNVAAALVAKLGHTPHALDVSNWLTGTAGAGEPQGVVVAGYDVCHLRDLSNANVDSQYNHIFAGARVHSDDGGDPRVLSRIEVLNERVAAETVPDKVLRRLLPPELIRGKMVIVHRDGRFPSDELVALQRYQQELEGDGTSMVLVEVVKHAGGTPRLYEGSKNVKKGSMLQVAGDRVIFASTDSSQGTTNPLDVRLIDVFGEAKGLDPFAWVRSVYDLSFMHHGSLYKKPKLPVTTYFADRLAYIVAEGGEKWDKLLGGKALGPQQPWL
eukprot:TRINITY_DN35401_c0_g1_i1.p1 TRINITY_DN35401_c0_g1~~TRINITY_DN35401_c0_g1_i1.p1  ORF type:complete len:967 (+),score=216.09 TRINITY_DN35401_c0_g1_i1:146-3046(+)